MPAVKFLSRLDPDPICLFLDAHYIYFDAENQEIVDTKYPVNYYGTQ